jgi:CheY-like chemotaxis protein
LSFAIGVVLIGRAPQNVEHNDFTEYNMRAAVEGLCAGGDGRGRITIPERESVPGRVSNRYGDGQGASRELRGTTQSQLIPERTGFWRFDCKATSVAPITKTEPSRNALEVQEFAENAGVLARISGDLLRSARDEVTALLGRLDARHPLRGRLDEIRYTLQSAGDLNRQLSHSLGLAGIQSIPAERGMERAPTGQAVLVVESNDGLRGLMGEVIRKQGYRVLEAGTAEEAERVVARTPYPLHKLVTEVLISGASGVALGSRLRLLQPNLGIVYTVCEEHDAVVPREALGRSIVLRKPFTVAGLSGALSEAAEAA